MKQPTKPKITETDRRLGRLIELLAVRETRIMLASGMQTAGVLMGGIPEMLPPQISLVSGPGCPESAPTTCEIDKAIDLCRKKDTIVTAFDDFLRVPGSSSSLETEREKGADVRSVESAFEALAIASDNRDRRVVFIGTGFEPAAAAVATAISEARRRSTKNFLILSLHRMLTPALDAALSKDDVEVDGVICPGHISAIIGANAYLSIAQEHGIPCVIAGLSPTDILHSIYMLLKQVEKGQARVQTQFKSAVTSPGNRNALSAMERVFRPSDIQWRGLGTIPKSGLILRLGYKDFQAENAFDLAAMAAPENPRCVCGDIITGRSVPLGCALFGGECVPENPLGPPMASPDGPCSAFHAYAGASARSAA